MNLGEAVGFVAPYYNLVLVVIVLLLFIVFLNNPGRKYYLKPWYLLCIAVCVYVFEELLTVLNDAGLITLSKLVAPFLEMMMISLFIYMLLLQREWLHR